jgi:predicted transcriptional regulator
MADFSPETRAFLSAIVAEGGEANTRMIRQRTQLTEGQLQYQFRKLSRAGYIDIEYSKWGSSSNAPIKVAHLTTDAQRAIKTGALEASGESRATVEVDMVDLIERVERLEAELDALVRDDAHVGEPKRTENEDQQTSVSEDEGVEFARRMGLLGDSG